MRTSVHFRRGFIPLRNVVVRCNVHLACRGSTKSNILSSDLCRAERALDRMVVWTKHRMRCSSSSISSLCTVSLLTRFSHFRQLSSWASAMRFNDSYAARREMVGRASSLSTSIASAALMPFSFSRSFPLSKSHAVGQYGRNPGSPACAGPRMY
ncbi:hypothetical protein KCU88_g234, partial [Aureobasidium melanogenum]